LSGRGKPIKEKREKKILMPEAVGGKRKSQACRGSKEAPKASKGRKQPPDWEDSENGQHDRS